MELTFKPLRRKRYRCVQFPKIVVKEAQLERFRAQHRAPRRVDQSVSVPEARIYKSYSSSRGWMDCPSCGQIHAAPQSWRMRTGQTKRCGRCGKLFNAV